MAKRKTAKKRSAYTHKERVSAGKKGSAKAVRTKRKRYGKDLKRG